MAAHPALHAAAALTTAVVLARWWATRAVRDTHGASAAKAPWRRTAPQSTSADAAHERVAELHTSFLDLTLREPTPTSSSTGTSSPPCTRTATAGAGTDRYRASPRSL